MILHLAHACKHCRMPQVCGSAVSLSSPVAEVTSSLSEATCLVVPVRDASCRGITWMWADLLSGEANITMIGAIETVDPGMHASVAAGRSCLIHQCMVWSQLAKYLGPRLILTCCDTEHQNNAQNLACREHYVQTASKMHRILGFRTPQADSSEIAR